MASKQLGKLRQWAGEKISSRDKSVVVDEFKELEHDIELRKQGISRLQAAAQMYRHVLSKKKALPVSGETNKLMPIDALGIVMVSHGEEFGEDSAFGSSLVKLGRAQCKIAMLQEAFALTLKDTFLLSCERFLQDIKDYEHQRKKLESRRSNYDAAISKLERIKNSKKEKEKERREAEDELQRCRLQFEETSEDVRTRMYGIQENETQQLHELTMFLDVQLNFAKQCVEVLHDVQENWCDNTSTHSKFECTRVGSRQTRSLEDKSSTNRSTFSTPSTHAIAPLYAADSDSEGLDDSPIRRKPTPDGKPMSRPVSRSSRKRSDSSATAASPPESTTPKSNKRMSMAGWASSAVSSLAGRGKKDRDNFAALTDGDESDDADKDSHPSLSRQPSLKSMSRKSPKAKSVDLCKEASPRVAARILKPPSLQEQKLVKALHDFTGSSDELTFKAGDEIVVVNEVLEDWWLGMLKDGRKGLFPKNYTTPITITSRDTNRQENGFHSGSGSSHTHSDDVEDDGSINYLVPGNLMATPNSATSFGFDVHSITSATEDDEAQRLMPPRPSGKDTSDTSHRPSESSAPFVRRQSSPLVLLPSTAKKIPPPPPPRRSTTSLPPPLIPDRPSFPKGRHLVPSETLSTMPSHGPVYLTPPPSMTNGGTAPTISPFDSLTDLSVECTTFRRMSHEAMGMYENCHGTH
ncbi:hypothetical protein PISMIDRAFT_688061 [Pisolithus microcarpus 441]|uniref:BAR-domain-containing protein n=1 Tax=Pisolithus microcarpus 441 TaxID=765257 RepID=A0A0C9YC03_9AGAM|nr:hypothetical protein BKA83DRAFT_688061 [Pisolithus microcarpus]KIK14301.1 hypothetical protein PISMIDRAFT_688061 [Pisolithus microcarpus 441]